MAAGGAAAIERAARLMTGKFYPAIALFGIIVLVYSPTFENAFVFDDLFAVSDDLVTENLSWLVNQDYFKISREFSYRPLVTLTHILDRLWGPVGGHLLNVVLHVLVCLSLYGLARRWMSPLAAMAGVLVFGVHPAYSEAVYVISFREDLLCAFFLVCALWAVQAGRSGFAGLALFGSLLAKETGLMLPVFLFLVMGFGGFLFTDERAQEIPRRIRSALPSLVGASILYAILRFVLIVNESAVDRGPWNWFSVQSASMAEYARLIFFPVTLSIDRNIPVHPPVWAILLGASAGVGLIYAAVRSWLKKSRAFFPLSWFLVFMVPTSNVLPLFNVCAERYLYVPLLLPALAVGAGWELLRNAHLRPVIKNSVIVLASLYVVGLGVRTHLRGKDFKDNRTLFVEEQRVNPSSYMTARALGRMALAEGRYGEARHWLDRTLRVEPQYYPALIDMGRLHLVEGRIEEAGTYFWKAYKAGPEDPLTVLSLASYHAVRGDTPAAKAAFNEAIRLLPGPSAAAMIDQEFQELYRELLSWTQRR